jgi:tRNA A-37 threonylcarbamoyl transferase component Bud32
MTDPTTCPECGSPIPEDATVQGLCPKCLIRQGLPSQSPTRTPGVSSRFVPPLPEDLAPRFPNLKVLELLGQGGMGAVYKARQRKLDRLVALKILSSDAAQGPSFAERFTREARALARLSHPNIVTIHDFGDADGVYYFVMEYVDGANLREVLQAGTLSPRESLGVVPQICDALQYAHEEGVVHRDIKPENILLDQKGQVKIADFGLAKMLQPGQAEITLTVPGDVMGTPAYMAPEQIEKPTQVDHRADIFSLGVVFYEMLTGELPLGRFEPPSAKVQMDIRLDDVVLRTLEKEPSRRYQHASEIKREVTSLSGAAVVTPADASGDPSCCDEALGAVPGTRRSRAREPEPTPGTTRTVEIQRPKGVTWVAVYCFFAAAYLFSVPSLSHLLNVGDRALMMSGEWGRLAAPLRMGFSGLWASLMWALALWHLFTGLGLLRLRTWARTHALVLGFLGLFAWPVATLFAIAVLAYLWRADLEQIFELGEGPATLTEREARRVERTMGVKK